MKGSKYPDAMHKFIKENVCGTTSADLAKMVNDRFGTSFTPRLINAYKHKHGLSNGLHGGGPPKGESKLFPAEVVEYIKSNHSGCTPPQMAKKLNEIFGKNYTAAQLKSYYNNHDIHSGVISRFQYGKTKHEMPVGTVTLRGKFYYEKIADTPNWDQNWKQKHILVWEEAKGPVAPDCLVTFLDGDTTNYHLENLALVTKHENLVLSQDRLRFNDPQLTNTGILIAKVKVAAGKHKKRRKSDEPGNK